MSEEFFLGKETTVLDDHNSLIEVKKGQDGLIWSEVYLSTDREKDYIGLYVIDGNPHCREWITYNKNYVAILSQINTGKEEFPPRIARMYDVRTKQFLKGTQEELRYVYDFVMNCEETKGESTK